MVKCSFWKAKVVRSLVAVLASLLIIQQAQSQSTAHNAQQKVSLSCNALQFQDVVKKLEVITGLHFVYSSNKIQINKPVTLNLSGKPLENVLETLGSQMDLVFKRNGQHIVIKTRDKLPAESKQVVTIPESKIYQRSESKLLKHPTSIDDRFSSKPGTQTTLKYPTTLLGSNHLQKHYKDLSLYFDTVRLAGVTNNDLQNINIKNNHRGWFVSSGFVINNYSLGAEFQAGLRSVYVVYSPSWVKDSRFHNAYGLGTSIPLKQKISFNMVYTYAHLKGKGGNSAKIIEGTSASNMIFSAKHHQVKLMMQYAFTKNINLRTGLTINSQVTAYQLRNKDLVFFIEDINNSFIDAGNSNAAPYGGHPEPSKFPNSTMETLDMWMSWEATISYKINFEKR